MPLRGAVVQSLKVRHNNILGYFIEVTQVHADKITPGAGSAFIHRQTMAGAMRFATVELGELETRINVWLFIWLVRN